LRYERERERENRVVSSPCRKGKFEEGARLLLLQSTKDDKGLSALSSAKAYKELLDMLSAKRIRIEAV